MRRIAIAALSLQLLSSGVGYGQTKQPEQKPAGAPDSTTETFGDWALICAAPTAGSSERVCEVDATLTISGQTAPVAKIAFVRQAKDKPARVIALVPVNVSFRAPVRLDLDGGKPGVAIPFKSCVPAACIAEAELTREQLQTFRSPPKGGQLVFDDSTGRAASLQVSFRGLDQALAAFFKRQEK
jgi:invasion protein IalB